MATVSERIKGTFTSAQKQLEDLEKQFVKIEKKAKAQLDEVPAQLKGAWEGVVTRLRGALAFATREELTSLAEKVDELGKKVDKLIRGEKIRAAGKESKNAKHA
jgi:polyhydroxyalkanoate synthesis regulator phasin